MATTVTGMTKFLQKNLGLTIDSTITASSGAGEDNIFDNDRSTFWISSGTDDTTDETLLIVFDSAQTFNRLIFGECNLLAFKVEYGSTPSAFTNVYTNDGTSLSGLDYNYSSETLTGYSGYFFEFDSVTTDRILITMKKTLTADQEKQLYNLFVGVELGTFIEDIFSEPNSYEGLSGFKDQIVLTKSNLGQKAINRGSKFRAEGELFELLETADVDLMYSILDTKDICFYPSGGSTEYGTRYRGFRIFDFYNCIIIADEYATFAHGRDKDTGLIFNYALSEI
jgi:hypothetical protein